MDNPFAVAAIDPAIPTADDILFAKNAGAAGIFVLTGHGRGHLKEIEEDTIISKNLYYAARKILEEDKKYTH